MINEKALFEVLDAWMTGNHQVSRAYKLVKKGFDPLALRNKTTEEVENVLQQWENFNEEE